MKNGRIGQLAGLKTDIWTNIYLIEKTFKEEIVLWIDVEYITSNVKQKAFVVVKYLLIQPEGLPVIT